MVESLDENVGRLLNYMESRGWRENAVILFLSDNGGFVNECKLHPGVPVTSNAPLRSGKGSCYEGGVRIPWIMDLPGSSLRQKVLKAPVTTCDLMPTVLSILGITRSGHGTGWAESQHPLAGFGSAGRFRSRGAFLSLSALLSNHHTCIGDASWAVEIPLLFRG